MKKILPVICICSAVLYGQTIPDSALYFGQVPPGNIAVIFAPGTVSISGRTENRVAFSPDRKMCFFSAMGGPVLFTEYKNDAWTAPVTMNGKFKSEPFFSLDGNRVYLNSRAALHQVGGCDISYSEKQDSLWMDPVSLGSPLNSTGEQYHPCIVSDSSVYFSAGSGEICRSQFLNGDYEPRVVLPYPINYANTTQTWGDPHVARDESSMIFRSTRAGGYGGNDIYISYKKPDGSWTNPKNLGGSINTSGDELSGDITPDGMYMTYGRAGDIYWVSADFIDDLRHTNFIPYVKNPVPDLSLIKNCIFIYRIPDTAFVDDDGNSTLSYSATLSSGDPLPGWLSFDSISCAFSGIPGSTGIVDIRVTARDTADATTSLSFKMTVGLPVIDYFGQTPPGDSAIPFIPGAVPHPERLEHAGTFSRDGKEFYFSVISPNWDTLETYERRYVNGSWTQEEPASFSSIYGGAAETFINNKNTHIVFVTSLKTGTPDGWLKTDLWIAERNDTGWGNPKKINATANDVEVHWHPSISDSGHIYFGSKGAVYYAGYLNDTTYGTPVKLNDPRINLSGTRNAEVCIAPDESYLIFSSDRSGGYGSNDLYICYRDEGGGWKAPVNIGPKINSDQTEFAPSITPDGKYLLFARDMGSTRHMYWVGSGFIDSLRQVMTEVSSEKNIRPAGIDLFQNYPNPFNPSTTIKFLLNKYSHVRLEVYNIAGQKVRTLLDAFQAAGDHFIQWDATDESGRTVSSGVYFIRLETNGQILGRKIVLLK